ncbi:hypothetical protein D3C75_1076930 [compost metagenome]
MAATLINVSMANQLPLRISRTAWRAIGHRPASVVAINAILPNGWLNCSRPQLNAIITISRMSGKFSRTEEVFGAGAVLFLRL